MVVQDAEENVVCAFVCVAVEVVMIVAREGQANIHCATHSQLLFDHTLLRDVDLLVDEVNFVTSCATVATPKISNAFTPRL